MKKLVSLVLAIMLVLAAVPFMASAEGEPEVITWFRNDLDRTAITHFDDTLWIKEIEKRLNIDLQFQTAPSADYYTVANAMLMSGDYPDIIKYDWNGQYNGGLQAAVEDGIIIAFDDYKEWMPNWFGIIESRENVRKGIVQSDGKVYCASHWDLDTRRNAYCGYSIRKDWLDRLNLAVPTTIDELYEVLKAFKEQDANGNGDPNDEIPWSACNWWGSAHPGVDDLAAAWGLKCNTMYHDPKNDCITFWTEYEGGEPFKQYVLTMAKWYAEGLLDEDYLTDKYDDWAAKITSDRAGCFFCFPDNIASWEESIKLSIADAGYADPEAVCIYGMVQMKGPDGVPYSYDHDNARNGIAGISQGAFVSTAAVEKGEEHLKKVFEFLDFCESEEGSDIVNWGVKDETYVVNEDGSYSFTDLIWKDADGYQPAEAVFKYAMPTLGDFPKMMTFEAWAAMNLTTEHQAQALAAYGEGIYDLNPKYDTLTAEEKEAYDEVFTDITTRVSEVVENVIRGKGTEADLDALIAQIKDMGIGRALEGYNAAYARFQVK